MHSTEVIRFNLRHAEVSDVLGVVIQCFVVPGNDHVRHFASHSGLEGSTGKLLVGYRVEMIVIRMGIVCPSI
jgi:hypothetical protein